jgi:hypothetical protein
MLYLHESTRLPPPPFIPYAGNHQDTAALIARATGGDALAVEILASAGYVAHVPTSDHCLLGSEWVLEQDGIWYQVPNGSDAEREAEAERQNFAHLVQHIFPVTARQREMREAQATLDAAKLDPETRNAIDALQTLTKGK